MTDTRPGEEPFPVVDVSGWPVVALEPGGTDEKVWLGVEGTELVVHGWDLRRLLGGDHRA
jgi:hypothetical protein